MVSKRLVELMNGTIGVESTVGAGSVFWVEFVATMTVASTAMVAELEAIEPPPPANGERLRTLLYVEDNPANLRLIEQLIARRADMRLLTAGDATSGIEIARASQPDVILMDINLPGISGLEALRLLRRDPATAHIPVMALSANAMPRDVERGLDAGFFRYLTKPVRIPEFLSTLGDALDVAAVRPRLTH